MTGRTIAVGGKTVLQLEADGPALSSERDASDVLSEAFSADADWIAIPVSRLADGFLDLKTRQAGLFIQKIVNYQRSVAFIGDISGAAAASGSLSDFVNESNRGSQVWFLPSLEALESRLNGRCMMS